MTKVEFNHPTIRERLHLTRYQTKRPHTCTNQAFFCDTELQPNSTCAFYQGNFYAQPWFSFTFSIVMRWMDAGMHPAVPQSKHKSEAEFLTEQYIYIYYICAAKQNINTNAYYNRCCVKEIPPHTSLAAR